MIDPKQPLPITRQCQLLRVARSSVYYGSSSESADNEVLMRRIDSLFTDAPYLGYRKITAILRREGHVINGKRVRRLMQRMGLQAVYPRPNTSKPHPNHIIYPYLLKDVAIVRPNQVWATDITYIPLGKGWCYLVAIIDWFSRYVVSWRLSTTMEVGFCVQALDNALATAHPEIFNSDQGSQFTSQAFTECLKQAGVLISMDGRGSYHDNIFTERLWRSVKYEEVYLKEYTTIEQAEAALAEYFERYNHWRPHQALAYKTPADIHFFLEENPACGYMDNTPLRSMLPTYPQAQQQLQPII